MSAIFSPLDIDGDSLPDSWEIVHFTNLSKVGGGDEDLDGSTNAQELAAGSNPTLASSTALDADNNSIPDASEPIKPYTVDSNTLHLWHLDETLPAATDTVLNSTPLPNLGQRRIALDAVEARLQNGSQSLGEPRHSQRSLVVRPATRRWSR